MQALQSFDPWSSPIYKSKNKNNLLNKEQKQQIYCSIVLGGENGEALVVVHKTTNSKEQVCVFKSSSMRVCHVWTLQTNNGSHANVSTKQMHNYYMKMEKGTYRK